MASPCSQLAKDAVEGPPDVGRELAVRRQVRVPCVIHELQEKSTTSGHCTQQGIPTQRLHCLPVLMVSA